MKKKPNKIVGMIVCYTVVSLLAAYWLLAAYTIIAYFGWGKY